jgi:hypothetical protein
VRERLDGLTDGRAELRCEEPEAGITQFTLRLPRSPSLAVAPSADVGYRPGR